jgi:hypothetical protein
MAALFTESANAFNAKQSAIDFTIQPSNNIPPEVICQQEKD